MSTVKGAPLAKVGDKYRRVCRKLIHHHVYRLDRICQGRDFRYRGRDLNVDLILTISFSNILIAGRSFHCDWRPTGGCPPETYCATGAIACTAFGSLENGSFSSVRSM
jgi:hypothetical protein